MFQLDRHKKIYDYIVKNKNATVNELADICEVATMTIRRDLDKMEKDGLITRVWCMCISVYACVCFVYVCMFMCMFYVMFVLYVMYM